MAAGVVVFAIGIGLASHFWGTGAIHLLIAPTETATVDIDGQRAPPPESRGGHQRYELARGKHQVRVTVGQVVTDYALELNSGLDELLLPASQGQCFVSVAVSANDTSQGSAPKVLSRYADHTPVPVAGAFYVGTEELPARRRGGGILIEVVTCSLLGQPDAELITLLGL